MKNKSNPLPFTFSDGFVYGVGASSAVITMLSLFFSSYDVVFSEGFEKHTKQELSKNTFTILDLERKIEILNSKLNNIQDVQKVKQTQGNNLKIKETAK